MASKVAGRGVGPGFMLFLVFLVLKLTGVISWSWWWVTAPLWIPFGIVLAILVVGVVIAIIAGVIGAIIKW